MSYLPLDQMAFADGPALDAFGRLRISESVQLLGAAQEYTFHPLTWDHYTVTGGTATHSTSTTSTVLRTNATTSGARAIRQTKVYYRYNPGKSHLIKMTGTLQKSGTPAGASLSALVTTMMITGCFSAVPRLGSTWSTVVMYLALLSIPRQFNQTGTWTSWMARALQGLLSIGPRN